MQYFFPGLLIVDWIWYLLFIQVCTSFGFCFIRFFGCCFPDFSKTRLWCFSILMDSCPDSLPAPASRTFRPIRLALDRFLGGSFGWLFAILFVRINVHSFCFSSGGKVARRTGTCFGTEESVICIGWTFQKMRSLWTFGAKQISAILALDKQTGKKVESVRCKIRWLAQILRF